MAAPGPWTWDARLKKWIPTPSPASSVPVRTWWVPAEGIIRAVIQSQIQAHLGPDATCRPYTRDGIAGYSLNATRTFTTEQMRDLQHASAEYAAQYNYPDVRSLQEQDRQSYPDQYSQMAPQSFAGIHPLPALPRPQPQPHPQPQPQPSPWASNPPSGTHHVADSEMHTKDENGSGTDEEEPTDPTSSTSTTVDLKAGKAHSSSYTTGIRTYQGNIPGFAQDGPPGRDSYGRLVDGQGQLIDTRGNRVDEYYRLVDKYGRVLMDSYGNPRQGQR